jgi:hypothetical protein
MTQSVSDFLLGGGGASAKFTNLGDNVTGTITVTPQLRQQTEYKTKKPKFWDDGQPMMQVVVTLQTSLRDPSVENDDGTRNVYIKGDMQRAVRDALRAAGAKGLEVGGTLTIVFVGEEPTEGDPKKLYQATYVPAASAYINNGNAQGQAQQQPDAWAGQVAQQGPPPTWAQAPAPAAPAGPAVDPNVIAAYRNLPPEQQDALTKGQSALRAALGLQG